ncbi:MAG: right-handed parallel beta-helix repeat-containing protein [Acidobacteria bacterium]|nr:right-handed parallel beta-helix repeat-containing protein [Acidobacteriota bacterium]
MPATLVAVLLWFAPLQRSQASPAGGWQPPLGIPTPSFGIRETAPEPPWPWAKPVRGFYYVEPSAPGATDIWNPYGTPASPRATIPLRLPAGAVVELRGTYDYAHRGLFGIVAAGTRERPVFIRGASDRDMPSILRPWEVSGAYCVLEHLRFRDRDGATTGSLELLSPIHDVALRHSDVSGNLRAGGIGVRSRGWWTTASRIVIYDNRIHDNGDLRAAFDQDCHGIAVGERVSYLWVVDNELARNSGDGIQINARSAAGEAGTHHIFVGRNTAHHNKQNGFWTKQATDVVFSQNVAWAHRPSNSSPGGGLGFQYAPSYVWFLFNRVYDSDFGIVTGSDRDLGAGTESFFIGNVLRDIHDSDGDFNPATGWQNCGISLAGGVNHYVINNTIVDVDSGICSPGLTGKVELHNNVVFGVRPDGQHVFLEYQAVAAASRASGNLFGPTYRGRTAGVEHEIGPTAGAGAAGNAVASDAGLDLALPVPRITAASRAVDLGVDDPAGVYSLFLHRYGLDIRRDFDGQRRPAGRAWDAGAFELASPPNR